MAFSLFSSSSRQNAQAAKTPRRLSCFSAFPSEFASVRPEFEVNFDQQPYAVSILGDFITERPDGGRRNSTTARELLADLEFEVIGERMTVLETNADDGHRSLRRFAVPMLDRALVSFPEITEIADILIDQDLKKFVEGLNVGLSVQNALLKTDIGAIYKRLGFNIVKSFRIRFSDNDPLQPLVIDAVFERTPVETEKPLRR